MVVSAGTAAYATMPRSPVASAQKRLTEAASGWAFVSEEADLKWSFSLEDKSGEATLWSILSPTLLLGYPQHSAIMPTEYVKVSDLLHADCTDGSIDLTFQGKAGKLTLRSKNPATTQRWSAALSAAIRGAAEQRRPPASPLPKDSPSEALRPGRLSSSPQPPHTLHRILADMGRGPTQRSEYVASARTGVGPVAAERAQCAAFEDEWRKAARRKRREERLRLEEEEDERAFERELLARRQARRRAEEELRGEDDRRHEERCRRQRQKLNESDNSAGAETPRSRVDDASSTDKNEDEWRKAARRKRREERLRLEEEEDERAFERELLARRQARRRAEEELRGEDDRRHEERCRRQRQKLNESDNSAGAETPRSRVDDASSTD
ncbi:hypothetical protein DIPPA_15801, partial [Diplonema papillatum]